MICVLILWLFIGKRTWTKQQNKELVDSVRTDDGAAAPESHKGETSFSLEEFLGFYKRQADYQEYDGMSGLTLVCVPV